MDSRNSCSTYFKITGKFEPDVLSSMLGVMPEKQWRIGDKRRNGSEYDFALWEIGRCTTYDVHIEKQMMETIHPLLEKVEILQNIRKQYDVCFTLQVVPSIYVGDNNPCLAPSTSIMKFCIETGTEIDMDLNIFDSTDDENSSLSSSSHRD